MAQFDVYRAPKPDPGYLLVVQSDLLEGHQTRVVVPLLRPEAAPVAARGLNPDFRIQGVPYRMVTQFIGSVPLRLLQRPVASLKSERDAIVRALDVMLSGI